MMNKRIPALIACLLLLPFASFAEHFDGTTAALSRSAVTSETSGMIESVSVRPGQFVEEGETLASFREVRVFAQRDGIVASCAAEEGDKVNGEVLQIAPKSTYLIYCTADSAYRDPETRFLHSGEMLYIRCTKDGTHHALGFVTSISGEEYQLETTGGELYVGETVSLYRDAEYSAASKVGVGTVVSADPDKYEAEGKLLRIRVEPGEAVEKGQLLFTYVDGESRGVTAPFSGIVEEVKAAAGAQAAKGDVLFTLVSPEEIGVSFSMDEDDLSVLKSCEDISFSLAADRYETEYSAKVEKTLHIADGEGYTVFLRPETSPGALGLTADVVLE